MFNPRLTKGGGGGGGYYPKQMIPNRTKIKKKVT